MLAGLGGPARGNTSDAESVVSFDANDEWTEGECCAWCWRELHNVTVCREPQTWSLLHMDALLHGACRSPGGAAVSLEPHLCVLLHSSCHQPIFRKTQ